MVNNTPHPPLNQYSPFIPFHLRFTMPSLPQQTLRNLHPSPPQLLNKPPRSLSLKLS